MTTFVVLHGAYQGGWIWKPTVEQLLARGHRVFAPTLDGCAERKGQVRAGITTETHAAEIAELLFYEDLTDVVLVGTSTGGMVVAAAAERARERIARLVFADALALLDGESVVDIVDRRLPLRRRWRPDRRPTTRQRACSSAWTTRRSPGRWSATPRIRSRQCRTG